MPDQIVIYCDGGLVQEVLVKKVPKNTGYVYIVDMDVDGKDDDEVIMVKNTSGYTVEGCVYTMPVWKLPVISDVQLLVDSYEDAELIKDTVATDYPLILSKMKTAEGSKRLAQLIKDEL